MIVIYVLINTPLLPVQYKTNNKLKNKTNIRYIKRPYTKYKKQNYYTMESRALCDHVKVVCRYIQTAADPEYDCINLGFDI